MLIEWMNWCQVFCRLTKSHWGAAKAERNVLSFFSPHNLLLIPATSESDGYKKFVALLCLAPKQMLD